MTRKNNAEINTLEIDISIFLRKHHNVPKDPKTRFEKLGESFLRTKAGLKHYCESNPENINHAAKIIKEVYDRYDTDCLIPLEFIKGLPDYISILGRHLNATKGWWQHKGMATLELPDGHTVMVDIHAPKNPYLLMCFILTSAHGKKIGTRTMEAFVKTADEMKRLPIAYSVIDTEKGFWDKIKWVEIEDESPHYCPESHLERISSAS